MSNEVKRYCCFDPFNGSEELFGEYQVVMESDYAALEAEFELERKYLECSNALAKQLLDERDAIAAELAAIKAQEPAHWWVDGVEYCQKPFTNDWHPHHTLPPLAGKVKA